MTTELFLLGIEALHILLCPGPDPWGWSQLPTAAPCRVMGDKWPPNGPWRTPGAQGGGKSSIDSFGVWKSLTWQVGTVLLWKGAFIVGSDPPLFLVLPVFWGCFPHYWALAMGLARFLLGCAPCAPCNPVQTAPELWDGSICCLLVLGLSAILQINLAGKSIFLTLSTLIYTTFPMMTSVTNPKPF